MRAVRHLRRESEVEVRPVVTRDEPGVRLPDGRSGLDFSRQFARAHQRLAHTQWFESAILGNSIHFEYRFREILVPFIKHLGYV